MLGAALKPPCRLQGCSHSRFFGGNLATAFERLTISSKPSRTTQVQVQASGRKCELTGKKANNGYNVTFSHIRNKKLQQVNLHRKRVFWPEGKRWVRLRISAQAIKTLEKKGLQAMAKEAGLDLYKLPYNDVSPGRLDWLAENHKGYPAQPKKKVGKSRRMKNPEKLAASKKRPLQARYLVGSRVILTRDPKYVEEYRD